jgi:hypothetical protein
MIHDFNLQESFEISPRFRRTIEERIDRLERDAEWDEAQVVHLASPDHVRRLMRLVAAQRAEALRMRIFLDRAVPAMANRRIPSNEAWPKLGLWSLERSRPAGFGATGKQVIDLTFWSQL